MFKSTTVRQRLFGISLGGLLLLAFSSLGCEGDQPPDKEGVLRKKGVIEEGHHDVDTGQCGEGNHMCCDSSGQSQCLTNSTVGPNLCPPGFDQPCDGAGNGGTCGTGNHACCDASGNTSCVTDAPPGGINLCPPGTDFC